VSHSTQALEASYYFHKLIKQPGYLHDTKIIGCCFYRALKLYRFRWDVRLLILIRERSDTNYAGTWWLCFQLLLTVKGMDLEQYRATLRSRSRSRHRHLNRQLLGLYRHIHLSPDRRAEVCSGPCGVSWSAGVYGDHGGRAVHLSALGEQEEGYG
jgi:hypothetical protein